MESILVDINAFAINLVEDHPGFTYLEEYFSAKNIGKYKLKILDIVPYRAFWILTKKWSISKPKAFNTIEQFIQTFSNIEYLGLDQNSLLRSFEYSKMMKHDIYDCYYLTGAVKWNCDSILTTDKDFDILCQKLKDLYAFNLNYNNPIPENILKRFSAYKM